MAGQEGVGPLCDGREDAPGRGQVVGRKVEQPARDLIDPGADPPPHLLADSGEHDLAGFDAQRAVGARGYHVRVLGALAEFGPASQAVLGRHAEMDRSDVTATVGELAAAGLVERAADAGDRRRNVITITAAGRKRLRELESILTAVQDEVLEPLSADERSVLTALLTKVLRGGEARTAMAPG